MKRYLSPQTLIAVLSVALTLVVLIQNARADQGNMHHALDALRDARYDLHQARGAKGGHRQEAIDLVDRAIEQVRAGIAVGEEND